jgi:hypothetical protein
VNLHQCRIVLRPRGPLEVFDLAFALVRAHPGVFLRLTALVVGPLAIGAGVGSAWTDCSPWWLLAPYLAAPLIGVPFTLLGGRLLFADTWSVRQVVVELLQRPAAVLAVLAWSLALELAAVATCGIGWVFERPLGAFLAEAALLERSPLPRLLSRSSRLAMLHSAGAISVVGAWVVLTAWAMVAGDYAGHGLFNLLLQLPDPFGTLQDGVVTPYVVVGGLLVQPFFAVYRVLQFVDVRTRVDGWDLQVGLRAARLGR